MSLSPQFLMCFSQKSLSLITNRFKGLGSPPVIFGCKKFQTVPTFETLSFSLFIFLFFLQQVQVSNTGTMYTIPAGQQQFIRGQLPPGVVLNSPGIGGNGQQIAEDASRKREMRLMKNRSESLILFQGFQ